MQVPRWLVRIGWCGIQIFAGVFVLIAGNPIWEAYKASARNADELAWVLDVKWWLLFTVVAIAFPIIGAARHRGLFAKGKCNDAIKRLLAGLSECYPQPNRTNIMLVRWNGERKTRRVETHTAHGMKNDADKALEIDVFAGVSGQAMLRKAYVWGDLTVPYGPGEPSWGLRPEEQQLVRPDLKTIVSVPIVDFGNPDGEPMGTLQVDSDLPVEQFLPDQAAGGRIAARFADVVALLLKERGG